MKLSPDVVALLELAFEAGFESGINEGLAVEAGSAVGLDLAQSTGWAEFFKNLGTQL